MTGVPRACSSPKKRSSGIDGLCFVIVVLYVGVVRLCLDLSHSLSSDVQHFCPVYIFARGAAHGKTFCGLYRVFVECVGMFITSDGAGGLRIVLDACGLRWYAHQCYVCLFSVSVTLMFTLLVELVFVSEIV